MQLRNEQVSTLFVGTLRGRRPVVGPQGGAAHSGLCVKLGGPGGQWTPRVVK